MKFCFTEKTQKHLFPYLLHTFLIVAFLLLHVLEVTAGTVDRGPYLQKISPTSVVVKWRVSTSESSYKSVHYGEFPQNYSAVKSDSDPKSVSLCSSCGNLLEHTVTLTNLSPGTRYYYEIGTSSSPLNESSARGSFMTPVGGGSPQPTRIWVIGDSGTGDANAAKVRDSFKNYTKKRRADLLFALGDNAYTNGGFWEGSDGAYQGGLFNAISEILKDTPIYTTFSDGEPYSDVNTQAGPFFNNFEFPKNGENGGVSSGVEDYYSFDYNNIHIVVLNSLTRPRNSGSAMVNWLDDDLSSTNQDWIICIFHNPPYSNAVNNTSLIPNELRENIVPILESHGVDLVLSGNNHWYERSFLTNNGSKITSSNGKSFPESGADGAYIKSGNTGTVYAVMGISSRHQSTNGSPMHPIMYTEYDYGDAILGSMILDIYANRMEAQFLDDDGLIRDKFTIAKSGDVAPPAIFAVHRINSTKLDVQFSEPVHKSSAETKSNYSLDNGVSISSAVRLSDPRVVRLTTSSSATGSEVLTVVNVKDYAANLPIPSPGIQFNINENSTFSGGSPPPPPPPPPPPGGGNTVSLQNGVDGYSGTRDALLRESSPNTNYGNDSLLWVDGTAPDPENGSYGEVVSVLLWDLSSIPSNAVVQSVSVTLNFSDASSGNHYFHEAKSSWSESTVDWNDFNNSGDIGSAILGTIGPNLFNEQEIPLNQSGVNLVQSWVDGSISNRGFVIRTDGNNNGIGFNSSEASSKRPKITITYSVGGGNTVSLQNGVDGYSGTRDASLRETSPNSNVGNDNILLVDGVASDPSNGNYGEVMSVILWDLSSIPSNAVVQSVSMTFNISDGSSADHHLYEAKSSWSESTVDWNEFSGSGEIGSTILGTIPSNIFNEQEIFLNQNGINIVQGWIDGSIWNRGFIIRSNGSNNGIGFNSSEASSKRPKITITYSVGGGNTVSLQNGVDGYSGTRDASLRETSPNSNVGNDNILLVDGVASDPSNGNYGEVMSVILWDLSSIPSNAVVQSVSMTFNISDGSSADHHLYEAKSSWSESTVDWNEFSGSGEIGSTILGTIPSNIFNEQEIFLNQNGINIVQGWIDGSIWNRGFIIRSNGSNNGIGFNSSEASSKRPKITITYSQ